jgi:hypothetical protein
MTPDAAKAAARRAAASIDRGVLDPSLEVRLDLPNGGQEWVSCQDMLDDPERYAGRTGSDPLEPDYGGGRNKAISGPVAVVPGDTSMRCSKTALRTAVVLVSATSRVGRPANEPAVAGRTLVVSPV